MKKGKFSSYLIKNLIVKQKKGNHKVQTEGKNYEVKPGGGETWLDVWNVERIERVLITTTKLCRAGLGNGI